MQASLLSSDHGSSLFQSKAVLSDRLPFKPDSPRHVNYNYTSTCTPLSATLDAPYRTNLISSTTTLTSRCRSSNGRFVPPLLCGNSSNSLEATYGGGGDSSGRSFRGWVEVVGKAITIAFPIWVALGLFLGTKSPDSDSLLQSKWIMMVTTFTMLGMGITLTFDDIKGAITMPKELFTAFFLHYSVMPISALYISKYLKLPSYYAAGLILVGCCPGGTTSTIMTYIARGNVALSVLVTTATTLSAAVLTPLLTVKLGGKYVAVDSTGLLKSTFQVVLLPVLAGALLNHYFKRVATFVSLFMPPISVVTVGVLCGNAIALWSITILMSGEHVFLAVVLLHATGFFFGYLFSRILGIDVSSSRTISMEVGMQNSELAFVLASRHYWNPLTAMPCAVSIVCNLILGGILAGIWRGNMPENVQVKRDL